MRVGWAGLLTPGVLVAFLLILAPRPVQAQICRPAQGAAVLLLYSGADPPTDLQQGLAKEAGIRQVDVLDASGELPPLDTLQGYTSVVVIPGEGGLPGDAVGDLLADYQDQGGGVIATAGSYYDVGGQQVGGRWARAGYAPYLASRSYYFSQHDLGDYDAASPLMHEITWLHTLGVILVRRAPGAVWVAGYRAAPELIAYKTTNGHTAVGIAADLGRVQPEDGEWPHLLANATRWLTPACPGVSPAPPAPSNPPFWAAPRYVPETGHWIRGSFRRYWQTHGGAAVQGYPLTDEIGEVSPEDGQPYTVQYFQQAVFEWHPANPESAQVQLRRLGAMRYALQYPNGAPGQRANPNAPRVFPQTGHTLGGSFRPYWEQHGGLAQFGYPLSEEFPEQNPIDGRWYTVQYFERAVLVWHPENLAPADVRSGELGSWAYQARYVPRPQP